MTSKRSKAEAKDAAPASASLVAEVYDLLLECSRKELEHLLTTFVKASSRQALESVRAEAIKRGAYVANKPSRYQQCSHATLDGFFSLLAPDDLRAAEVVCRRWRGACKYSNAGWIAALSRAPLADEKWKLRVQRRQIPISRLSTQSISVDRSALDMLAGLKSLTAVQVPYMFDHEDVKALETLPLLSLQFEQRLSSYRTMSALREARCHETLTSLELPCDNNLLLEALQFPRLQTFTSRELRIGPFVDEHVVTSTTLTSLSLSPKLRREHLDVVPVLRLLRLPNLRKFTLSSGSVTSDDLQAITCLASLNSLVLDSCHWQEQDSARLASLTQLTALENLHLGYMEGPITTLGKLTQLSSLRFWPSGRIDTESKQEVNSYFLPLHSLPRLETLVLDKANLHEYLLPALPATLTSLTMDSTDYFCPVKELQSKRCLPKLKLLAFFDRTRCFSPKDRERLKKARPHLTLLEKLNCS